MLFNNRTLVKKIERSADRLGLIINHDESIQSGDFLVYGKTPVFRGNILSLDEKQYSKITCVSNDSGANILSSVTTNVLSFTLLSLSLETNETICLFWQLCKTSM